MRNRLVISVALALVVTGCTKKAGGQTVAVVNGEEITASELNAELASANMDSAPDKNSARTRVLQGLIDRRLLAQQARKDGLDKSPEFLARSRKLTEELLLAMLVSRQLSTAQLPGQSEMDAYQAQHPESFAKREFWNVAQIYYPTPQDPGVSQKILASKTLGELETVLGQAGISFQRGQNRLDSALVPHEIYQRIVAAPQSEPFIIPAGSNSVASVIMSREPAPRVGADAKPVLAEAIRRDLSAKILQDRVKVLRQAAKISYQNGFKPK